MRGGDPPGKCLLHGLRHARGANEAYGSAAAQPAVYMKSSLQAMPGRSFGADFAGFIVLGALFVLALMAGALSPMFLEPANLSNIMRQFSYMAALALAVTVSTRAKGPDLSLGSMVSLSAVIIAYQANQGAEFAGLFLAVFVLALIGFANGIVTVFCKVPAVLTTLVTGTLILGLCLALSDGKPIIMPADSAAVAFGRSQAGWVLILLIATAIAFLLSFFAPLKKPKDQRGGEGIDTKFAYAAAYAASAVIACIAGYFMAGRLATAPPMLGTGVEIYLLFVYFALAGSRLLDNALGGVFYALAPAFVWSILANVLILLNISSYEQLIYQGLFVTLLGIFAFVFKKKATKSEFDL